MVYRLTELDICAMRQLFSQNACIVSENEIQDYCSHLSYAFPNPFNPETSISYNLTGSIVEPKIDIFNLRSQLVRSYDLEIVHGKNSIVWNGRDSQGNVVSSGVYFYTLKNNGKVLETRKMTLLK